MSEKKNGFENMLNFLDQLVFPENGLEFHEKAQRNLSDICPGDLLKNYDTKKSKITSSISLGISLELHLEISGFF